MMDYQEPSKIVIEVNVPGEGVKYILCTGMSNDEIKKAIEASEECGNKFVRQFDFHSGITPDVEVCPYTV